MCRQLNKINTNFHSKCPAEVNFNPSSEVITIFKFLITCLGIKTKVGAQIVGNDAFIFVVKTK